MAVTGTQCGYLRKSLRQKMSLSRRSGILRAPKSAGNSLHPVLQTVLRRRVSGKYRTRPADERNATKSITSIPRLVRNVVWTVAPSSQQRNARRLTA
ncbi:hypothetical protein BV20DRAFT_688755 [Pilatotrama ljubarskyi]|nr:hypothetical protein BV20DRAFT_688755 [Pilatotrama ljubarskyi]